MDYDCSITHRRRRKSLEGRARHVNRNGVDPIRKYSERLPHGVLAEEQSTARRRERDGQTVIIIILL